MNKKQIAEKQAYQQWVKIKATLDCVIGFGKTRDNLHEYSGDSNLYYLPIEGEKFIVITISIPKENLNYRDSIYG